MKTLNKMRFIALLLTLLLAVMMAVPTMSMAAQPTVNLRTTSSFAVLAGTTITNTGPTTISGSSPEGGGDVGLYPGSAFPGQADVTLSGTGTVHINDTVAIKATTDLEAAYDDAAGRTPVTTIPTELGGTTLKPGTYDSADGTFQITGTLTLDAQDDPDGVFVFKTASTLITAAGSNVNIINGARYCRVFWKVGSSATLGTNSHFVGHIFALTSIAAQTGATVQGQLLARNGAVTLDTNTITNGICASTPTAAAAKAAAKAAAAKAAATKAAATTLTGTAGTTISPATTAATTATNLTGTAGTTISPATTAATTATNLTGTAGTTVPEGLPDTGESAAGNNMVIGLILLVLAASILTINLRRTRSR